MRSTEVIVTSAHQRAFGNTGLRVPPLVFDAGVLGNARSVLPEQTRFEIVGEWLRRVAPPVFVHVEWQDGAGEAALKFLARALCKLDASTDNVIVSVDFAVHGSNRETSGESKSLLQQWDRACEALGCNFKPRLAAIQLPNEKLDVAALRAPLDLKVAGDVAGVGVVVNSQHELDDIAAAIAANVEWLFCSNLPNLLEFRPEVRKTASLSTRNTLPIIANDVFAGGFLVGDHNLKNRAIDPHDSADQALLAWRKSFVALCHGHGIAPAHACIQFALRQPMVIAVILETSHPDVVAENARWAVTPVPEVFWDALVEEGLLRAENL